MKLVVWSLYFLVILIVTPVFVFSADIKGYILSDTTWSGTINVMEDVSVLNNKTLTIAAGTTVNIKKGANLFLISESDLIINGTSTSKVIIKNYEGTKHFGSICAKDANCTIEIKYADISNGQIKGLSGTTIKISDSFIHQYVEAPNAIILTDNATLLEMNRTHISNYIELNFINTLSHIDSCLFEYMRADAIDFDNSPEGTYIKNTTIRHGVGTNIDAIDWGKVSFQGLGSIGLVDGCTVYDITDKGVSVGEGARGVTVRNCVFNGIGRGVAVKDSSIAHIDHNTFYNCITAIDAVEKNEGLGGGHATTVNNIVWDCAESFIVNGGGTLTVDSSCVQGATVYAGVANINSNPLFVNTSVADFSLNTNSPAIGAASGGTNMGANYPRTIASVDNNFINVGDPSQQYVVDGDTIYTVAWTSGNSITQIKIEYSVDDGLSWNEIVTSTDASSGEYNWNVPNIYSSLCKIKISDINNSSNAAMSFGNFTIVPRDTNNANGTSFSILGGYYTSVQSLSLSAEAGATIYYTLDGSEPTDQSNVYSTPIAIDADTFAIGYPEVNMTSTKEPFAPLSYIRNSPVSHIGPNPTFWEKPTGPIFKATIVKTRVYFPGKGLSKVKTQSYFVDPNMINSRYTLPLYSLTTDKNLLFDYYKGIYIPGADFTGYSFTGNYERRGRDSEIPMYIEMYLPDGTKALGQNIGVRVKGEWIRSLSQKSLGLYARSEYDSQNDFMYELFPGLKKDKSNLPLNKFKRLSLRNAGNDFPWKIYNTIFKDGFVQNLFSHMNLKVKAYEPSIVFINGEYWGIQTLMEESDGRSLEENYNLDRENIVIMEHNLSGKNQLVEGIAGDDQEYINLVSYVNSNGLSNSTNYNYFKTKVDVNSLMDNWISILYACKQNYDHNILFWRYKNSSGVSQNLFGSDGKWRWMTNDFDNGFFNMYVNTDVFSTVMSQTPDFLIAQAMQNTNFKNEFINRFADQLNSAFRVHRVKGELESIAAKVSPNVPEHAQRFGSPSSLSQFNSALNDMYSFINGRTGAIYAQLMSRYGLDTTHITVNVDDISKGFVKINTLSIDTNTLGLYNVIPYPWKGTYFKNIDFPITAVARPGYKFLKWQETNQTNSTITINLTSDVTYTALFEEDTSYSNTSFLFINEVMSINNNVIGDQYNEFEDWVEVYNASNDTVDLAGYYFTDNFNSKMIPYGNDSTKIAPKGHKLFWADEESEQGVNHLNFKLSSSGDYVALYSPDRFTKIDEVTFSAIPANQSYGRFSDGDATWKVFTSSTPGNTNLDVKIKKISQMNEMVTYPNPTSGITTVKTAATNSKIKVEICNLVGTTIGQTFMQTDSNGEFQVNFSSLSKGVYLIKVSSDNFNETSKIIVK